MEYRYLGKTGLRISELCLGTMTFGREADESTSQAMIARFLESGGNFIDTSNNYGKVPGASEEILGRALKKRNKMILTTKVYFPTGPDPNDTGLFRIHIMRAIEASLKRLQTDYIDLYQVHCWDAKTPLEDTISTLDHLVKSGKVRYIGASNFAAWQLMKALSTSDRYGWERFVCLQPQYSLVVRDIEREILPLCRAEGLGVIAWGPLGGGFLSGKYRKGEKLPPDARIAHATEELEESWRRRATDRNFRIIDTVAEIAKARGKSCVQVALAWVRAQEGITAPIIGARSIQQLEDNLGAIGWDLSQEELEKLNKVSCIDAGYPYRFIQCYRR